MAYTDLPGWIEHFDKQIRPKCKSIQVTGAAADTNIAVAGAKTSDTVVCVYNVTDSVMIDPKLAKFTTAANLQLKVTTATKTLHVLYFVK